MRITMILALFLSQTPDSVYLLDSLPTAQPPALWPVSVPFPKDLKQYERAKFTQSIATRNDRPAIDSVSRRLLLARWTISGGMEGIRGFRSDVFVLGGQQYFDNIGFIQVKNSFGYFQPELGHVRRYADGNLFVDLLSHDGKAFELRVAEKQNGQWRRYVAYKDESARPKGYTGLKVSCMSCHNNTDGPGTGNYGVGLISGGDTIFSFPFEALEK